MNTETPTNNSLDKWVAMAAINACVLGGLGIFSSGIIAVPLGAIAAIVATVLSIKAKNTNIIWVSVLAWGLLVIACIFSPWCLALVGDAGCG